MAAQRISLNITDAYRVRLLNTREQTARSLTRSWQLDWADLDGSFRRWLPQGVAFVEAGQVEAVRLSGTYLSAFVAAELGEDMVPSALTLAPYVGQIRDGRTIAQMLAVALVVIKLGILERRPQSQVLSAGLARVIRDGRSEVMNAGRASLRDAMSTHERVIGWRRVTSGQPCGACLAAASGEILPTSELPETHSHCRCTAEPVMADVPDTERRRTGPELFDAMSNDQQDRLFAGRGGAAKAELLRSGAIRFADLITTEHQARWGTGITETPLADLLVKS